MHITIFLHVFNFQKVPFKLAFLPIKTMQSYNIIAKKTPEYSENSYQLPDQQNKCINVWLFDSNIRIRNFADIFSLSSIFPCVGVKRKDSVNWNQSGLILSLSVSLYCVLYTSHLPHTLKIYSNICFNILETNSPPCDTTLIIQEIGLMPRPHHERIESGHETNKK